MSCVLFREGINYDLQMTQKKLHATQVGNETNSAFALALMSTVSLIILAMPVYAFYTRGFAALKYVALSALALFVLQTYSFFRAKRTTGQGAKSDMRSIPYWVAASSSLTISATIYGVGVTLIDGYEKLPITPSFWMLVGIGAATLAIGLFCFWLRSAHRTLWGVTEVGVGVALPVYRAGEMTLAGLNTDFAIFALTAGVYLIVRGLDNMSQGRKEAAIKAKERYL